MKTRPRIASHYHLINVGLGHRDAKERRQVSISKQLAHVMDDDRISALVGEEGAIEDEVPRLPFRTFENDG